MISRSARRRIRHEKQGPAVRRRHEKALRARRAAASAKAHLAMCEHAQKEGKPLRDQRGRFASLWPLRAKLARAMSRLSEFPYYRAPAEPAEA